MLSNQPLLKTIRQIVGLIRDHLGAGLRRRRVPIADRRSLAIFLNTRAAHVSQISLYGYLRTRAGTRFPDLFSDDPFVVSINIAKWNIWLACLSDLSIHVGGLLAHHPGANTDVVRQLMTEIVDQILTETGAPTEAGADFAIHADRVRTRVAMCDWMALTDDESPFSQSPAALVQYAPIVEELKQLDDEIVRNSMRFRWQEIRRYLRSELRAGEVLASARPSNEAARPVGSA